MESFRFKVVKIISKEPFKRGRWLCMDFTDPPSNGTTNIEDCLAQHHPDITSSAGQGVSAVAIDNKIEQAMDLVKSHLMFAVREEMDVLKAKIFELTEENSRFERENQILKANATSETLQLLVNQLGEKFNQRTSIQPRQNSPSNQISIPPLTTSQTTTQQQQSTTPTQITTSAISTINSTINTSQYISQPSPQQLNQTNQSQIS